jgi:hypothetical protein
MAMEAIMRWGGAGHVFLQGDARGKVSGRRCWAESPGSYGPWMCLGWLLLALGSLENMGIEARSVRLRLGAGSRRK